MLNIQHKRKGEMRKSIGEKEEEEKKAEPQAQNITNDNQLRYVEANL